MTFVLKPNTFSAFKKDKTDPKHSDLGGTLKVGETEFWMDVWIRQDKNGNNYISGTIKEKKAVNNNGLGKAMEAASGFNNQSSTTLKTEIADDEIPF